MKKKTKCKGTGKEQTQTHSKSNSVGISSLTWRPMVALFKNYFQTIPIEIICLWDFLLTDQYYEQVREHYEYMLEGNQEMQFNVKSNLPCVTVSGIFDNRSAKRLYHYPSGCICIDIDGKDNPLSSQEWREKKQELGEIFDSLCYAGRSISRNGLCLIFRIAYPERHREHFNALVCEIRERTGLVADEKCSDIARLRGASYDKSPYFKPNAEPYVHLQSNKNVVRAGISLDRTAKEQNLINQKVRQLVDTIVAENIDITDDYADWIAIAYAFAAEYGKEEGLRLFHRVSMRSPKYYPTECDEQFYKCFKYGNRTTIKTFFYICKKHGVKFKK